MIRTPLAFALMILVECFPPLGVASAADPQQPASPRRIAVLPQLMNSGEAEQFRKGLREAGYLEGRDLIIEWHVAPGDTDRLPTLVGDVVRRNVDVIVVTTTFAAQAAKRATSSIPIVIASSADPVRAGLVENLAHPGGNITGFSLMETELHAKRLELLKEALPSLSRVAVLWNPNMPSHPAAIETLKAAAPSMGIALHFLRVREAEELDRAFETLVRVHVEALYVLQDQLFTRLVPTIIKLAAKARVPVVHANRYVAEIGGLMSYGPDVGDLFRRAAKDVDKILKGANPGDLPIEQPEKFELVVNLKTAKALGITISEPILLRADEVIR